MKNGIHLTSEHFCEFCTLIEDYGVWKSPREVRNFLLTVRDGCADLIRECRTGARKGSVRTPKRAAAFIGELLNGRHFLMLYVKRRSDIPRIERLIDAMGAEAVELCDTKRVKRKGYLPENVADRAFFIIAFDDEGLRFHEVHGNGGLCLFSTLGEDSDLMPLTYCLNPGPREREEQAA